MKLNILVVEDQKEISSIVMKYLEKENYNYKLAQNGFEALELFAKESFHLVLLDIMMPGIDGFQVLSHIRSMSDIPVIILTAKEQEVHRLKGFDLGADDYVIKPFSPRELMRRIKVILKRVYNTGGFDKTVETSKAEKTLVYGELILYLQSMRLLKKDKDISITTTEFHLMKSFMLHQGQVLSREQLIQLSFGQDYDGYDRNIDSYIKRLRRKIEDNPSKPIYLNTKYGAGYVFGGELI